VAPRLRKKPGPKPTIPKFEIAKMHSEGVASGNIAKLLDLKPMTVYRTLSQIRADDDGDRTIAKCRELIKKRVLANGMVAVNRAQSILEIDTEKVPQVAMAQAKLHDSTLDRIGVISQEAKEGIDINILIYQQNEWS